MLNPRLEEVKSVVFGKVSSLKLIQQSCCLCVKKLSGTFFLLMKYRGNGDGWRILATKVSTVGTL